MVDDKMLVQMRKLNRAFMIAFFTLGLALIFWSVFRAPGILIREDNPRLVEAELRIHRGQILDRQGTVLAATVGPPENQVREYPVPSIGPAVGYYSFRHGTAGIEESYDGSLRGETADFWDEFWRQTLRRTQAGRDIRLTLDARLQDAIESRPQDQAGAAILLNLPQAEILAMASFPGYDPNKLDENFETLTQDERAPLLNRVALGQYQPGLVLQPLIVAAALNMGLIRLNEVVPNATQPVLINGVIATCATPPPAVAIWADILISRCPGPMVSLANRLGVEQLGQIFDSFGLTEAPILPLDTETAESEPLADANLAGIGQGNLLVTPLQVGLAWAALGLDGRIPSPRLVAAVQDDTGQWQDSSLEPTQLRTVISPLTAGTVRGSLPLHEGNAEYQTLVLSGPQGSTHAWYLGLAPADSPDFAVVVIMEDTSTLADAAHLGRALLSAAQP